MKCAQCDRGIGKTWIRLDDDGLHEPEVIIHICSFLCLLQYATPRVTVAEFKEYIRWFSALSVPKPPEGSL